ncbi:MAG: 50S ribosomal protein L10 [Candidatus Liptonbacteria bacterium]|nr:50S ribosomal protein L10 [Candidatus Liptonbacteria bacterium]
MKTKSQKGIELEKGRKLLAESEALVFADFSRVSNENLKKLRKAAREAGAEFLVIKKRLLNVLLKEKGIEYDAKQFGGSVGTIFSKKGVENISGPVYSFFSKLEVPEGGEKGMWAKHILGAYDTKGNAAIGADQVVFIGKLPPREVLLAQLLGMLAAPLRSFMYLLQEKSKRSQEVIANTAN